MKLYYTPTSPFVRKVMVAARELGLQEQIETTLLRPTPLVPDAELSRRNPLSKIPALLLDDGLTLYDSPVICDYLDSLAGARRLVAQAGADRWRVLRVQALCDGILDAAILVFYESSYDGTRRPAELQWAAWIAGQTQKVRQGLDALGEEIDRFGADVDLGQICAGVTLGWLEFRGAVGDVRAGRAKLFEWYDRFSARPSMRATAPQLA